MCTICKHPQRLEIDRDLERDRESLATYAARYGVNALEIVGHLRTCLVKDETSYAAALRRWSLMLGGIGEKILEIADADPLDVSPALLRIATEQIKVAAQMEADSLAAKGLSATRVDVVRSPHFKAFLREIVCALEHERFAVDDWAALAELERLAQLMEGES